MNRRTVLKLSAAGLAAGAVPVGNVAADSPIPDASSVKPGNEASALPFVGAYLQLETRAQAEAAWRQLSEAQADTINRAIRNNIEIRHQRTLNQGVGTTDVTADAIPVSYTDNTQHVVLGEVIYELEHTIEWSADTVNNAVRDISRSTSGRSPPPFWEYRGVVDSDLDTSTSFFDSYVEGKVDHEQPLGDTYFPELELRGRGDGSGTTLLADNGF